MCVNLQAQNITSPKLCKSTPLNIDEKLNVLTKQIDSSIHNIKVSEDTLKKQEKLDVWKNLIIAIIGLTKQFLSELRITAEPQAISRVEYYEAFLKSLKSQLIHLTFDQKVEINSIFNKNSNLIDMNLSKPRS